LAHRRENYFLSAIGELIKRIQEDRKNLRYGLGFPATFSDKLGKLSLVARRRVGIDIFLVHNSGKVDEVLFDQ